MAVEESTMAFNLGYSIAKT
jgi:hypothetical protein